LLDRREDRCGIFVGGKMSLRGRRGRRQYAKSGKGDPEYVEGRKIV